MKRRVGAVVVALAALGAEPATSIATTPPGQQGNQGQPDKGGYHQPGQQGYEGQPGSQDGR